MVKISINYGGTNVAIECGAEEVDSLVQQIPQIIENIVRIHGTQQDIPFKENVEIKDVTAHKGEFTQEELNLIDESKKRAQKANKEDNEDLVNAEAERLAEQARKDEAKQAQLKKEKEEKLAADEEAEKRASRAKQRRKRSLFRQAALEDGPLSSELIAEEANDAAEAAEDEKAEKAYQEKYGTKEENKKVETQKPQETVKAPVVETTTEEETTEKTEVEETEEVENKNEATQQPVTTKKEEEPADSRSMEERAEEVFQKQKAENSSIQDAVKKVREIYAPLNLSDYDFFLHLVLTHPSKEKSWNQLRKRPENMLKIFKLSAEDVKRLQKDLE